MNDRNESSDVWAEVVAAVEFLRDGPRPGINVWDVLDDAIRCWLAPESDDRSVGSVWIDPDPLRSSVELLFRQVGSAGGYGALPISSVFTSALRDWLDGVRRDHNDGQSFTVAMDLLASRSMRAT